MTAFALIACAAGPVAAQEKKRPPGPSADDMLKRLDKDGDGRVSRDEYIHDEFDKLDRNRDGVLDEKDVPPRKQGQAEQPGPAKRFKGLDKDQDGRVTFAEYADGPILDRFKSLDKDGSGYLERAELEAVAAQQDADQRRRLPDFIARFDANRDGAVSRDEFPGPDAVFERLDVNGDGKVTKDDLPRADGPLAPPPPPAPEAKKEPELR